MDLNKTCSDEDVITFNGENYRQLCSPTIELGRIDSVHFTLSTGENEYINFIFKLHLSFIEPCTKRNKLFQHRALLYFFLFFTMVQLLVIQEQYVEYYYVKYQLVVKIKSFFIKYKNLFSKLLKLFIFDLMSYVMLQHHLDVFVYHNIINHREKMLMYGVSEILLHYLYCHRI